MSKNRYLFVYFYIRDILFTMTQLTNENRVVWVDWMRVAACFMVILVHATEPFYLGGQGSLILTEADAYWASLFDSLVRACVPLFIVASSYLQFPLHYSSGEFFRRRAVRVLVPFVLWSVVYAFAWGNPAVNFQNLLFNFNYAAGHLWFVYMLIGVYLLMPLLSPWAERVGKRELQVYLAIWAFTTLIPHLREIVSGGFEGMKFIYGVSGLPRAAQTPLWGEAGWNTYGTFYYISGFVGYLLMGLYFRRFVDELSWRKTLGIAIPCYLAGFVVVFGGFLRRVFEMTEGVFPVEGLVEKAMWWETTWCNDTAGVALMTVAWILIFKKIKSDGCFYQKVLLPVSKASYGIYLLHLLLLVPISGAVREWLGLGLDGRLGVWTSPVEILLSAIIGFLASALIAVVAQRIPKAGKYLVGVG